MRRRSGDAPEPDLATRLREAFTADDPGAAWYFDRAMERVVRVADGATDIPDLPAEDVEDDEDRYVEIPPVTDGETHAWMEQFVEACGDAAVASLLDERHGANARFLAKLAASDPAALLAWKAFHAARVAETVEAWRAENCSAGDGGGPSKVADKDLDDVLDLVLSRWRRASDEGVKARLFDGATSIGARIVEPLLVRMDSPDADRRAAAHALLQRATGLDFGWRADATADARGEAVVKWQTWWLSAKAKLIYDGATKRLVAP